MQEENDKDDTNYKVGYGKPPKHSRFQKGNNGNKKGRKPKEDKQIRDLILEKINKKITVTKNSRKHRTTSKDVIAQSIINALMTGNQVPRNNLKVIDMIDRYSRAIKFF